MVEPASLETVMDASSKIASKEWPERKTPALPGASVSFVRRLLTEGRDRLFCGSGI
jgi:hypothetical protein